MLPCTCGNIVSPIFLCTLLHSFSLHFHLLPSQHDDATLKDLKKVVPNIRHSIMWCYEVTWNVDFALVDEREKNRMQNN